MQAPESPVPAPRGSDGHAGVGRGGDDGCNFAGVQGCDDGGGSNRFGPQALIYAEIDTDGIAGADPILAQDRHQPGDCLFICARYGPGNTHDLPSSLVLYY